MTVPGNVVENARARGARWTGVGAPVQNRGAGGNAARHPLPPHDGKEGPDGGPGGAASVRPAPAADGDGDGLGTGEPAGERRQASFAPTYLMAAGY